MRPRQPAAQRGVFAILFAVLLVVILAMAGLAIDMGFVYERHGDMKSIANAAALAAAHQLDGTADGVENAIDAAEDSVDSNTWGRDQAADWDEAALTFGTSADGPWLDGDSVRALAADEIMRYRYARVDAGLLDADMGIVVRYFPYRGDPAVQLGSVVAVAGPVMTQMAPLAVCAMNKTRYMSRPVPGLPATPELVEHGFRRGITYNLLRLNPEPASTGGASFLVNPLDFPGSAGGLDTSNFSHAAVAPFVCAGSMAQPPGNEVYVQQPFPVDLIPELNSRFGQVSTCPAALPDRSIKEFVQASWLNNNPRTRAHAVEKFAADGALVTVADLPGAAAAGRTKEDYGTVWAYARPVRYSATAANRAGAAFKKADADELYPVDSGDKLTISLSDFTSYLPYNTTFEAPSGDFLRYRRILHVPLLDCPVTSGSASVLAIGKFMLTAPASNADPANPVIAAEFGGLLPGGAGSVDTRLFR